LNERIGVFVCNCGTNISEGIDTDALVEFAKRQSGVTLAETHSLACSEEGRDVIAQHIKENGVTHVVVAACSPKQHEATFQKVLADAGLNPHMLQMANIREQVAWVTPDRDDATEKAKAQLDAAIRRVMRHEPIEKEEIDCNTDFLVVGAGVAGMSAALALAQKGRHVTVVERDPWIGGKVVAFEEAFPNLECAPCMLEPLMDHVLHHERITVLTGTEVVGLKGFFGNFDVTIHRRARYVDAEACMGCGACYEPCPALTENPYDGGLSQRHAIFAKFAGALPNLPTIDMDHCLRGKGEECTACEESCFMGAIRFDDQDETSVLRVGGIIVATGFDLLAPETVTPLATSGASVFGSYEFERMLCREGPTEGKIVNRQGVEPKAIAFIHCAGSRDTRHKPYCSGVCCANTLKLVHLARHKLPEATVYEMFSDWCLAGKGYDGLHRRVSEDGIEQIRIPNPNDLEMTEKAGRIAISAPWGGEFMADMVVLSTAIVPAHGAEKIAQTLGLGRDAHGFFGTENDRIAPANTLNRGIYVAGCATGPKDISQSVLQGQAAAGMALSALVPGDKLELEAATSVVNPDRCGGCRICAPLCPYQAIDVDAETKTAKVNSALCRGCGVCAAACPSGAIRSRCFTDVQLRAELQGVLA
jgi:heterodisulfide reductase subunit A